MLSTLLVVSIRTTQPCQSSWTLSQQGAQWFHTQTTLLQLPRQFIYYCYNEALLPFSTENMMDLCDYPTTSMPSKDPSSLQIINLINKLKGMRWELSDG